MEKLLKSLSDFHDSQIQKLNSELNTKTSLVSALENMVQSLKEENISQKLEIQQLLFKIKELESMYVKSKEQLLEQENTFTTKQNSWNKFKEKIKEKISKKTESRYKVSKLVRGDRDLSVAESMPWAQKQKDVENRPGFAYSEVVRKKDERKRMNASDCACCKDFYEACGLPKVVEHEGKLVDRIQLVSKHRFVHKDPDTPQGYWDLDYNALYSTDEENDTKEGKRKRLEALEAQKKSKIV